MLGLYNITGPEAEIIAQQDIINPATTLTFIDRRQTRRLVNQTALVMALGAAIPAFIQLNIRAVDFAEYPFEEQLRIACGTDVLVGVHGAGLTHAMFMKGGTSDWVGGGVVVELQPEALRGKWDGGTHEGPGHVGFKNLARMLALGYQRIAAREVVPADGDDEQKKERRGSRMASLWMKRSSQVFCQRWSNRCGRRGRGLVSRGNEIAFRLP